MPPRTSDSGSGATGSPARHAAACFALLLTATAGAYWSGLSGPLLLDDYEVISPLLELSGWPDDWRAHLFSHTGPLGRPVAMLSFLASLALHGKDLFYWKLWNLGIHLAIALLLLLLTRRLLRIAGAADAVRAQWGALVVAGLWLVHPLQVSTVLYTVQRMTQLSALFAVAGMLLYVEARAGTASYRTRRVYLLAAFLVCLPLAALSKETGLLLPGLLAVLEWTLLRRAAHSDLRAAAHWLLTALLVVPGVAALCYYAIGYERLLIESHLNRGFEFADRLMTQARVLMLYLGEVIAPAGQRLGFLHDDLVVSQGLLAPPTTALAILGLAGLTLAALTMTHRWPLFSCGILVFLIGHALESSIFPLELMFEHRNYLPSYGVLLALVGTLAGIRGAPGYALRAAAPLAIALLLFVTHQLSGAWASEATFYRAVHAAHPRSERAITLVAESLSSAGRYAEALRVLATLDSPGTRLHAAVIICRRDQALADALLAPAVLGPAPALSKLSVDGLSALAKLGLARICTFDPARFKTLLEAARAKRVAFAGQRQKLSYYLARYRWLSGEREQALADLEAAFAAKPSDPMPLFLAAEWAIELGDSARARAYLARGEQSAQASGRDYAPVLAGTRDLIEASGRP